MSPYSELDTSYDEFNNDWWKLLLVLAVILVFVIIKCS